MSLCGFPNMSSAQPSSLQRPVGQLCKFPLPKRRYPKELLTLDAEEENESYNIYSVVLKLKEPNVNAWTILPESSKSNSVRNQNLTRMLFTGRWLTTIILKNKKTFIL